MKKEIYGTFNGEHLIGEDGKSYPIQANYASKSLMVEGDEVKLTIYEGKFIYKQIKHVDRIKFIAEVIEEGGKIMIINEKGRAFGVAPVAISFFKLVPGDEVVAIIPKETSSYWAAIEMVTNR